MKKFFMATAIVALFGGLLLTSCSKSEKDSEKLIGKWILIKGVHNHGGGEIITVHYNVENKEFGLTFQKNNTVVMWDSPDEMGDTFSYTFKGKQISVIDEEGELLRRYTVEELTSSTLIVSYDSSEFEGTKVTETYVK